VVTPSGSWISYNNTGPTAATEQGQLDKDDRTNTGPENVFWNGTAPTGVYHICFDQYTFNPPSSPTNPITATFLIRIPGRATQTIIKTFTSGGRLNNVKCNPLAASYVTAIEYP